MKHIVRSDTGLWQMQVWAAFAISVFVTCLGIWAMPTDLWLKGYMLMGLFFTLGSTFTLAKQVRDNRDQRVDTSGWVIITWTSFALSLFLTSVGLYWLPMPIALTLELWVKSYLAIGIFAVVTSTFTLAKTVRDNEEAKQFTEQQRTEEPSTGERSSFSERLSKLGLSTGG